MQSDRESVLTQMRKGVLEYCVLARLRHGEAYGLELASDLARRPALLGSEGTLYPLLARLRRQGLVETSWRESPDGPPRRYYDLTADGKSAIDTFTATWADFRQAVDSALEGTP